MSDTADALTEARNNAAYWEQQAKEIEAKDIEALQGEAAAATDPYHQPTGQPVGPGPRELVQEVVARAITGGARTEDAAALAVSALAQRGFAGDPRFIVSSDGSFYRDGVD